MPTSLDTARMFLEPMPEPPRRSPMPRRRFVFELLLPCALTVAGGLAVLVMGSRGHSVPKPGPRRYPPGYRRTLRINPTPEP